MSRLIFVSASRTVLPWYTLFDACMVHTFHIPLISQSVTQAAQKKNLSTPNRNQICDLLWLVTNSDALPLSYRSLVGSKATKLHVGSCDKHTEYC